MFGRNKRSENINLGTFACQRDSKFTCDICNKKFTDLTSFQDHQYSKTHLKALGISQNIITHSTLEEIRNTIDQLAIISGYYIEDRYRKSEFLIKETKSESYEIKENNLQDEKIKVDDVTMEKILGFTKFR